MNRLHNLDYLRGVVAFGIMIYHYTIWGESNFSADTFFGRLGIYGVSIFYVLSGLTLHYVYFDKMKPNWNEIYSFFKKRIFRIFPLLWLATFASIFLSRKMPDLGDLALNLTGLFGFVKWDTYFSAGIWSIGNELVFYAFFPFFVLFTKKYKPLMILLSVLILGLYLFFAFEKIPNSASTEQWRNIVNPLNQVFLFLGGFLIGIFFEKRQMKNSFVLPLLLLAIALFVFYPVSGDQINLQTGINRLVFTASSILICLCLFKLTFRLSNVLHKPLNLLGEASYSVYLLHPVIYVSVGRFREHTFDFSESTRFISSVLLTLICSYFVYQYFEKYFMRLGRNK